MRPVHPARRLRADSVRTALLRRLRADPRDGRSWAELARQEWLGRRPARAMRACDVSVRLDPTCGRVHELRALIALAAGRLDVALSAIGPALDLAPSEPTIWYLAGCLALSTHAPSRALGRFLRCLDVVEARWPDLVVPASLLLPVARAALDECSLGGLCSRELMQRCGAVQPLVASIVCATGRSPESCSFLEPVEVAQQALACEGGAWRTASPPMAPRLPPGVAPAQDREWRCLLVDDSRDGLDLLEYVLRERGGLDLVLALSGREALLRMNGAVFDLAFVNHMMPQMNGRELIARMRLRGYDGPIAVTSASMTDLDKVAYLSAPLSVIAVLELPLMIGTLLGLVDEMALHAAAARG